MEDAPRGPLAVCTGGSACRIGASLIQARTEVLLLDTDSRSIDDADQDRVMLVGQKMVNGEGSGGNLNLARTCFRMDLEQIAVRILGRPLVMFLADMGGATSIAGTVEMNSLLTKVGSPSVVILFHDQGAASLSNRSQEMMMALLSGPLRPGIMLNLDHGGSTNGPEEGKMSKQDLLESMSCLLYTSPSPRDRTRYSMPSSA